MISREQTAQTVKNPPAMQETWVGSLGWEDTLEKEMAIHSSILPGESRGWRSLVGYSPWGCKESDMTEQLHFEAGVRCTCSEDWLREILT